MVLLLHSQRQYIFDYDSGDRLSAVTMPSVARHTMQTVRSIGYYRNMYTPPESNASVTVDYSEDGQVGLQAPLEDESPLVCSGKQPKCFVLFCFRYFQNLPSEFTLSILTFCPFFKINSYILHICNHDEKPSY